GPGQGDDRGRLSQLAGLSSGREERRRRARIHRDSARRDSGHALCRDCPLGCPRLEGRNEMETARRARTTRSATTTRASRRMPAILEDVPPGYDWGWYSREDPRMHLQVVDRQHKGFKYKVWLEARGRRIFTPANSIP